MKFTNRVLFCVIAVVIVALSVTLLSAGARAQGDGWWIVRAEYGTRNQHNDVTDILKDLVGRGGVNGRVAVNNQTMGGDPAVGADKTLHILAKNARNEERTFDFREGAFVPADMFVVRHEERHEDRDDHRDDRGDRPPNYDDHERREAGSLQIMRAYYGVQGRTVDVTEFVRGRLRGDSLSLMVSNRAFGGDPAIGSDKVLIVIYRFQGTESATAVHEGNMLTLP
jgi:hypothetical protein